MGINLRKTDDSQVNIRFSNNHFFHILYGTEDSLISLIVKDKEAFTFADKSSGIQDCVGIYIRPEDIDNMIDALKTVKKYT